jgi:addiction module HigA family antidote
MDALVKPGHDECAPGSACDAHEVESSTITKVERHGSCCTPRPFVETRTGRPKAQRNRLSLDIGVPSGRITDILNGRRGITADTAVRLGRYFGNSAQFWLDLQGQYDIGVVEREKGAEIARRVRPADAA